MDGITHFQLPYDDRSRAQNFYEDAFGWQIYKVPEIDYHWINTVESDQTGTPVKPGVINGGMFQRHAPNDGISVMVTVDSINDQLKRVEVAGGSVALRKTPVGRYGFMAQIVDTEGNRIGLWEYSHEHQDTHAP